VTALQTTQRYACATPANWQEGDKVVVPPPKTLQEVEESLAKSEYDHQDFYFALKDISKPPQAEPPASAKTEASKPAKEEGTPKSSEAPVTKPVEGNVSSSAKSAPSA
jgi:hypothetical protein